MLTQKSWKEARETDKGNFADGVDDTVRPVWEHTEVAEMTTRRGSTEQGVEIGYQSNRVVEKSPFVVLAFAI